jgi:hypothetical protein
MEDSALTMACNVPVAILKMEFMLSYTFGKKDIDQNNFKRGEDVYDAALQMALRSSVLCLEIESRGFR